MAYSIRLCFFCLGILFWTFGCNDKGSNPVLPLSLDPRQDGNNSSALVPQANPTPALTPTGTPSVIPAPSPSPSVKPTPVPSPSVVPTSIPSDDPLYSGPAEVKKFVVKFVDD